MIRREDTQRPQRENVPNVSQEEASRTRQEAPTEINISRVPSLTLPKGGGAIRGIGEKFAANPVTGTDSMTVPIATSPGRSSFGPQFPLSYDSGAGNGPFCLGWSFALPSISHKTDKGLPQYCMERKSACKEKKFKNPFPGVDCSSPLP